MSENFPFASDFLNNSTRITDIIIGLLLSEAIRQIRKHHVFSRKYNIRKQFGWVKILSHLFSAIMFWNLETRFSKIHLQPLSKLCHKMINRNIEGSIVTFSKTEPELFMKIGKLVTDINTDYKIYKATGVKSALLERYLPNMT